MDRPSAIQIDEKPAEAERAATATWHDPGAAVQILLDDGKYPVPIVPLNLTPQERTIVP